MFTEQPKRTMVIFSAAYKAQIGFAHRLSHLAEDLFTLFDSKHWIVSSNQLLFRDFERKFLFVAGWNQLFVQTLDLDSWTDAQKDLSIAIDKTYDALNIRSLDRLGLKLTGLLDIRMTHPEMVDQIFGSILSPRDSLRDISDNLDDVSVSLFGTRAGRKFRVQINPQTPEQVKTSFFATPNLEALGQNPDERLITTLVRDTWKTFEGKPAINIEVEVYHEGQRLSPTSDLTGCDISNTSALMKNGVKSADDLARRAINLIKTLPNVEEVK